MPMFVLVFALLWEDICISCWVNSGEFWFCDDASWNQSERSRETLFEVGQKDVQYLQQANILILE